MLDRIRDFLRRLFPPELTAYIPGAKLIAGVILAVLSTAFGVGEDQLVELPIVGEVPVGVVALALGVYLFPEKEDR